MLRQFLIIYGYTLLVISAFAAAFLFEYLLDLLLSDLNTFFLTKTSSTVFAVLGTITALFAIIFLAFIVNMVCDFFTAKIINNHQSFMNENSNTDVFSEVYNDPTIGLKDKVLFFSIYLIYHLQLPFLYCTSRISYIYNLFLRIRTVGTLGACIFLPLL